MINMKIFIKIAEFKNFVYFGYDTSEFKEHIISFEFKSNLIGLGAPDTSFFYEFSISLLSLKINLEGFSYNLQQTELQSEH